ncbi:MAG: slipin family protein [Candidatus Hydrothermarchaeota archaeon]
MPNGIFGLFSGVFPIVVILILFILYSAIRIVKEYERGVVFRLGRLMGARGPGLFFLIPIVEKMVKIDLRTITLDVPSQDVITRDNVPVRVNAVVYFRVVEPEKAIVEVENYMAATSQISQTTLRSVIGQVELDEVLSEREKLNRTLQQIIDSQTDPWGIKVTTVEIKDVELPEGMKRAMAKQAEAERDRRGRIILADGEAQAAEKLRAAAEILSESPASIQLRFLQTLAEISAEKTSTVVFPLPIEFMEAFHSPEKKKGSKK